MVILRSRAWFEPGAARISSAPGHLPVAVRGTTELLCSSRTRHSCAPAATTPKPKLALRPLCAVWCVHSDVCITCGDGMVASSASCSQGLARTAALHAHVITASDASKPKR